MAAPMDSEKLPKNERKMRKKHARSLHTLKRHEGIETVDSPTNILFVANAGLGNGVTRDEVVKIFRPFGMLDDVVMIVEKPYAFVSYSEVVSAVKALEAVNGKPLKCPEEVSSNGLKFYTAFVKNVPDMKPSPNSSVPPGLILLPDFISEDCEKRLINCVQWEESEGIKEMGGQDQRSLKHRRVKHYGYEFIYGINNVDPEKPLQQAIPGECDEVLDKILSLGYIKKIPDQLTVNQYEPGQGIPPHVDTHSAFEDGIISLSTGAQVVMDFRHPDGAHIPVVLPPRSLLIMTSESRYQWTHGITPRKTDVVESDSSGAGLTLAHRAIRTSFTFRVLRRRPCDCDYPDQCDSRSPSKEDRNVLPKTSSDAAALETKHVHEVYEEIATHFSDTRHSPWPKVAQFLKDLQKGALVVDVGCGNGKYLGVNSEVFMIGNDRSVNLSTVCCERGFHVFVCDCLSIPLRPDSVDACICIAVIHHLTTKERRLVAIKEITSVLRVGGRALIYVWALEQELNKVKSNYLKKSKMKNRGDSEMSSQGNDASTKDKSAKTSHKTEKGYMNTCDSAVADCDMKMTNMSLTDSKDTSSKIPVCNEPMDSTGNELELKSDSAGMQTCSSLTKIEKSDVVDNSLGTDCLKSSGSSFQTSKTSTDSSNSSTIPVHVNRTQFKKQDMLVPWHKKDKGATGEEQPEKVYHRFYHVFKEGELEELCGEVPDVRIAHSYYDKGNWCVIIEKTS